MDRGKKPKKGFSRRDFLKGVSVAVAGGVVLSVYSRRLFRGRRKTLVLPEDSVFTPAHDTRKNA